MSNGYTKEIVEEILTKTENKLIEAFKNYFTYTYHCDVKIVHIPHINDPKSYDKSVCNQVVGACKDAKSWAEMFGIKDFFVEVKDLPILGEDGEYSHSECWLFFALHTNNDTTNTKKVYDKIMYTGGSALANRCTITTKTYKIRE